MKILHISDLHFAKNLLNPRNLLLEFHSKDAIQALHNYWQSNPHDYVILTGDVSTDGTEISFQHSKHFMLNTLSLGTGLNFGLNLNPDQLLILPGNHDRYKNNTPIMKSIENFENAFNGRIHCKGRPRSAYWLDDGNIRLRVLSLDSCGAANGSVARGKIHKDDLKWLEETYQNDLKTEQWDLRILLLHHHIALPKNKKFNHFTKLKNRFETLKSMLAGHIDMAMYGHEHYAYAQQITYREAITKKKIRNNLRKKSTSLEKKLAVCMCGTTTALSFFNAASKPNLAWSIEIDKDVTSGNINLKCTCIKAHNNTTFVPYNNMVKNFVFL